MDEQEQPLILKDGYFCLRADRRAKANVEFRAFYRDKGRQRLTERVEHYKDRIGVNPGTVRVMELKNRWASCSTDGALNFHWKCMMAPLRIIDYIVVHELTHLLHPRHTQAFWNQLDKILPDYQDRRHWLRQNGAGIGLTRA